MLDVIGLWAIARPVEEKVFISARYIFDDNLCV